MSSGCGRKHHLRGRRVGKYLGKATLSRTDRDSNPHLPVIGRPVQHESDALDHSATETTRAEPRSTAVFTLNSNMDEHEQNYSEAKSEVKDKGNSDEDRDTLSHEELVEGVTLEEVGAQVALEQGQSMTIKILRGDGEEMAVVVPQRGATVLDLKRAIRRHVELRLNRSKRSRTLSWRYVWRSHWLYHDAQKLKEDWAQLADYGIHNKSRVKFVKRLREKGVP
uniref:SNRNP25 ubiquitin-like domain-containing protein n=1 Tax=Timema bartmani TaxID=61472 RepID=A0A7R9FC19_9NEOP|nr:unnamed protein product [Timema bartmani]